MLNPAKHKVNIFEGAVSNEIGEGEINTIFNLEEYSSLKK